MIRNYLKTGWRNLTRNKVFSCINISGLALGMACSILIALWVNDEYNIDAFHEHGDRIFVVTSREYTGAEIKGSYSTPGLLGEELKKIFPEVEFACNYSSSGYFTFAVDERKMKLPGAFAGADFFRMFSYPLLLGTPESSLQSPEAIAISRRMATNLFGSPEAAMDQSVKFDNDRELKVTAVFEDLTDRVSGRFEYVLNWDFLLERQPWSRDWQNRGPSTFVRLHENAEANAFAAKMRDILRKYDPEYSDANRVELDLQRFQDRYLQSNFENGVVSGGRIEYVRLFEYVAIFILVIACINFMNLSTARSIKRAKEIGVRKVTGAMRTALIVQFMLEAFIFTLAATFIALLLVQLVLPQFNLLTGKHITFPLASMEFWIGTVVLLFIVAVVSGSYPAFLLSSFRPASVLKGNYGKVSSSGSLRKGLVVFQFALSIIFIIGMTVTTRQIDFVLSKDLGYEKENLIYLQITGSMQTNFNAFKHEALQIPGVTSVTRTSQRPVEVENTIEEIEWEGKDPASNPAFTRLAVGYDFIETMKSTLVSGRDFSEGRADAANYIVNETALRFLGYEHPVGMRLRVDGREGTIIGVVRDFHFNSLHVPITPLVLSLLPERRRGYSLIRFEAGRTQEVLAALESLHERINPEFVFAHQFADEEYAFSYQREKLVKGLSQYFAFIAIFISCLGLLGLAIFSSIQRTKELGIRKVLGASTAQIVVLLSKDYLRLIFVAFILSAPIAWYVMDGWLSSFGYHIDLEWWMFVLAAAGTMAVALLTISFNAAKAGLANPVKSLQSE